jgi:hypothetical protein
VPGREALGVLAGEGGACGGKEDHSSAGCSRAQPQTLGKRVREPHTEIVRHCGKQAARERGREDNCETKLNSGILEQQQTAVRYERCDGTGVT